MTTLFEIQRRIYAFNERHGSIVDADPYNKAEFAEAWVQRSQLMIEELGEMAEAVRLIVNDGPNKDNVTKLMDAYGDLLYVVIGTGATFDLPSDVVLEEVCDSNDTKHVTSDPRVRDKGPDFRPPNFDSVVRDFLDE